MPIWSNAGQITGDAFMQRLAMNEMLRKQEQERQRQQQEIQTMFRALGLEPPQGPISPTGASTVANFKYNEQQDKIKNAEKTRTFQQEVDAFVQETGGKYGVPNTPAALEMAQKRYSREQSYNDRVNYSDYVDKREAEQEATRTAAQQGEMKIEFDNLKAWAGRDWLPDYDNLAPTQNTLNIIERDIRERRQTAGKAPQLSSYGEFLFDRATRILDTQGVQAFSRAIGRDPKTGLGEIAILMTAIEDDKERAVLAQRLNMLELQAMDSEMQRMRSQPQQTPQLRPQFTPQPPIPGTGPRSVGQIFGEDIPSAIRGIRPPKTRYLSY